MLSYSGEFSVPCKCFEVYEFLMDPHRLAKCLSDVKNYEVQDSEHFSITIKVGVGRIKGPMGMNMEIADKKPNQSARITGKGKLLNKPLQIDSNFSLVDIPDGATLVKWTANAKLSVYLMTIVGGLAGPLVKEYVERFVKSVEAVMTGQILELVAEPEI